MLIEGMMLGALGALIASLLWLLALPVVARRAGARAAGDIARQMPMSMAAINAEKDRLRAGHTAELRRLEQANEALQRRLAAAMGDGGRHVTRIVVLEREAEAARARIASLQAEAAAATRAMHGAEAALGTQAMLLHDTIGLVERHGALLATTEAQRRRLDTQNEERRATIAALETRATGEELRLRGALGRITRMAGELAAVRAAMDEKIEQWHGARADGLVTAAERDALKDRVAQLVEALASLEADRAAARDALSRSEQRLRLQVSTIADLGARIAAQDAEHNTLHRLLEEAFARRDALQAERLRLLAAASADAPVADTSPPEASDARAARLRAAVAALAADLVRFATTGEPAPADAPAPDTADHAREGASPIVAV